MSVSPLGLEAAILRAIARVPGGGWLPCSYGELRNRIAEVDPGAANENINVVLGALVSLGVQGHLELAKIEAGERLMFDFQRRKDDKCPVPQN